ncbi:TPA: hypothetical protein SMF55_001183 [Serratia liquefaciens]|nr:hypothetical protein [Serratia liquefaciens]
MFPACRSDDKEFSSLKGDEIGYGHARTVYKIIGCDDYVLKEAKEGKTAHNENEAGFYYTSVIRNLTAVINCIAEIRSVSKSGKYLIMEKLCTDLDEELKAYAKKPIEVDDKHSLNFGMTKDKKTIKCLDYGSVDLSKTISGEVEIVPFQTDESVSNMRGFIDKVSDGL